MSGLQFKPLRRLRRAKYSGDGDSPVDDAVVQDVLGSLVSPHKQIVESSPLAGEGVARSSFATNDEMDNSRVRVVALGSVCYVVGIVAMDSGLMKSPTADRFLSSFKPLSPK